MLFNLDNASDFARELLRGSAPSVLTNDDSESEYRIGVEQAVPSATLRLNPPFDHHRIYLELWPLSVAGLLAVELFCFEFSASTVLRDRQSAWRHMRTLLEGWTFHMLKEAMQTRSPEYDAIFEGYNRGSNADESIRTYGLRRSKQTVSEYQHVYAVTYSTQPGGRNRVTTLFKTTSPLQDYDHTTIMAYLQQHDSRVFLGEPIVIAPVQTRCPEMVCADFVRLLPAGRNLPLGAVQASILSSPPPLAADEFHVPDEMRPAPVEPPPMLPVNVLTAPEEPPAAAAPVTASVAVREAAPASIAALL